MNVIRKKVSHYRVIKKIGTGGMGEVYQAEDTRLGRKVALKLLPKELAQDKVALERFARESKASSALDHPNICTIHDVGDYEGRPFLVMQYLEGETLRQLMERAPFPTSRIVEIALQVATGLEKAHSQGIVHRDIKPANLILTPDGIVKILDFGLAKLSADQHVAPEEGQTNPGNTVGTALYMSPEQIRGDELTTRTDLFSLGVILYEMATGKLPFNGSSTGAVYDEILNRSPITPVRINPEIPDDLEHIIEKCLEKDPGLRYQSPQELIADLKRLNRDSDRTLPTVSVAPARRLDRSAFLKGGALVAALGFFAFTIWYSGVFESPPLGASVGVVPFQNASGISEQEALADGLTEDIVANLSKISGLSIYRFKGIETSPEEKADELGVANLLEGTIRRSGDDIRVSTQLVEARTGRVLWSENYDKEVTDLFALQTEIALQVAAALEVELLPGERSGVASDPTHSVEAYDLYLQGRFLRHTQENPEGLRQAIEYFRQAIELDHDYALAYSGLAECYFMLSSIYGAERWDEFGEAASVAVHYGNSLPEPHVAMGLWLDFSADDPEAADQEFQRALELDPRHSNARREYARFLMRRGRFDEALREIEKVHDPMFAVTVHLTRSEIYRYRGEYARALDEAHQFQEIWSGSDEPLLQLALSYIALVEYEKAEGIAARISQAHPARYRLLGLIAMLKGNFEEAREICRRLIEQQPDSSFSFWLLGQISLIEEDNDRAREYFEAARHFRAREDLNWWRPYSTFLGVALSRLGEEAAAEDLFAERIRANESAFEKGNQHPDLRRDMAVIYAMRGDTEQALGWLEKAVDAGYARYDLNLKDGLLRSLYELPRFQQLTLRMRTRVAEMARHVEAMEEGWESVPGSR